MIFSSTPPDDVLGKPLASARLKKGKTDYVSDRVFDGTRPLSGKTATALRAIHKRNSPPRSPSSAARSASGSTKPNDEPESPAIITSDHVQDRVLHTRAGSKVGWSKLTVFEQAHRAGKLIDKDLAKKSPAAMQDEIGKALDRFLAGKRFMELWLIGQASIGGSMDFSRVRCAGSGVPFSDTQFDAKTLLRAIEGQLGTNDWMICRRVIGENCGIAETVNYLSPSYRDSTLARFREALDSLCEAFNRVRVSDKRPPEAYGAYDDKV